jgi:hypothetical protein
MQTRKKINIFKIYWVCCFIILVVLYQIKSSQFK